MNIQYSYAKNRKAKNWESKFEDYEDFVKHFQTPVRTRETQAQYEAMSKDQRAKIKDGPAIVGGTFKGGRRTKKSHEASYLLTLDFDKTLPGTSLLVHEKMKHYTHIIYPTHSSSKYQDSFRLILPLLYPVDAQQYEALSRTLAQDIDFNLVDRCSYSPVQMMYLPTVSSDAPYKLIQTRLRNKEHWIDPEKYLAEHYENWQDPSQWPGKQAGNPQEKAGDPQEEKEDPKDKKEEPKDKREEPEKPVAAPVAVDNAPILDTKGQPLVAPSPHPQDAAQAPREYMHPEELEGAMGVFCRAYNIHEAIAEYLSDLYRRSDEDPNRYTYIGGSTENGAVVYNDNRMQSYHNTDPASQWNKPLNSFQLVALHIFGDADKNCKPDTPYMQRNSAKYLVQHMKTNVRCREEQERHRYIIEHAKLKLEAEDNAHIAIMSHLDLNKNHEVAQNSSNMSYLLEHDLGLRHIYFDTFRKQLFWNEPNEPFIKRKITSIYDRYLMKSDENSIVIYLDQKYHVDMARKIKGGLSAMTNDPQRQIHPIKKLIESKPWDGVERMERLFIDYLGVLDRPIIRTLTAKFLCAAVARLYEDGVEFDYVPTFVGGEGAGKSKFWRRITFGDFYSNSLGDITNKDAKVHLQKAWIVEFAELAAFKKASPEQIKMFVAREKDDFRMPYGTSDQSFPRHCVFVGSSNYNDFLERVNGGNRRFWPFPLVSKPNSDFFEKITLDEAQQIWAEVYATYLEGKVKYYITPDEIDEVHALEQGHTCEEISLTIIQDWLCHPVPKEWKTFTLEARMDYWNSRRRHIYNPETMMYRHTISAKEIAVELLSRLHFEHLNSREIVHLMEASPYIHRVKTNGVKENSMYCKAYKAVRFFIVDVKGLLEYAKAMNMMRDDIENRTEEGVEEEVEEAYL